ncbi:MAG TPA: bacteriocin [Chitinophaga sp.]|uniref:bacteriocin n=1 Tax=Chitinophaga sp. TaxID=1869181 RepID=UPI002B63409C|nr:bacteriocin [Chitinophaga sp.]HVI45587.1 bacteriocin [Chitinophaga sp.]
MKKLSDLGQVLTKKELKAIIGGRAGAAFFECNPGYCNKSCGILGCGYGYCAGGCFCGDCPGDFA